MAFANQVHTMFITYFGRPPAKSGLDYYVGLMNSSNGNWKIIVDDFFNSAESKEFFAGLSVEQQVNKIFMQAFGRPAAVEGLNYWTGEVIAGRISLPELAYTVANNASPADLARLTARIESSKAWVEALNTSEEILAYSTQAGRDAGRAFLDGITDTAKTPAEADAALAALGPGTGTPGQTFTLTAGTDVITPTTHLLNDGTSNPNFFPGAGDDLFRAPADGLLGNGDLLNGGGGMDTLTAAITAAGQTLNPTLQSIEKVFLTVTGAEANAFTFNANNTADIQQLWFKDGTSGDTNNALGELHKLDNLNKTTIAGLEGGQTNEDAGANRGLQVEFAFKDAAAGDTQKLAFNKAKADTLKVTTAETVEITATGTSSVDSFGAAAVKTLNIKGDGKVNFAATDLATTVTVNASTNTGGVNFAAENGSALTFTGGSGNDRVLLGNITELTSADKIDLAGGANTLAIGTVTDWTTTGITAAQKTLLAGVKNAQTLEATAANVTAVNFDFLPFTTVALSGANTDTTVAVADVVTSDKLVLLSSVTKAAAGDVITVTGKGAANTFGLELNGAAAVVVSSTEATATNAALSITSGVDTVNIHSTTSASNKSAITNEIKTHTATADFDIENGNAGTFNITGDTNLKIGLEGDDAGFNAAVNIDATNFTGKLEARGSEVVDNIKGGSGNDTFHSTTGADTYTLNGGNDTVTYSSITHSVLANRDKITDFNAGGSNDKLNLVAPDTATLTATQLTNVQNAVNALPGGATLSEALDAAANSSAINDGLMWFEFGGNTYVYLEDAGAGTTYQATDLVIELSGTGLNLSYTNDFVLA